LPPGPPLNRIPSMVGVILIGLGLVFLVLGQRASARGPSRPGL